MTVKEANQEQLKQAIDDKRALQDLISSKGWSKLCDILKDQVRERTDQVMLVPLGELHGIERQEFMKGEVSAYRTLMHYPELLLEVADAIIAKVQMETDDDDEG